MSGAASPRVSPGWSVQAIRRLTMRGRARVGIVAMTMAGAVAVAPAGAGERTSPPPFRVANRGVAFRAPIGTHEWCYSTADGETCDAADYSVPPKSERSLPVRAGDEIVLRPHAKLKSIEVSTYDYDTYPNQPQPVAGKPRQWTLRVANGVGKGRRNLVAYVRYAGGGDAEFGFAIRRVKQHVSGQPR
jgi:hypothetical protein